MAAEQHRDGSGVGGGSLFRSVDESVGSVGGSFGGSCSSIGSGVSRLVYWPLDAMSFFFCVASGTFFHTYVGLYVVFLLTDLSEQWWDLITLEHTIAVI